MKILFSHSYFLQFDPKQRELSKPYPPLGTILAAAVLRENGHEVLLHDTNFELTPHTVIPKLDDFQPDYFVIYDDGFNYLTKMCLTNMREAAFKMIEYAKERGIKVAVCSSDSTDHFEKYLDHGADLVLLGEGEETLLEIVNYPEKNIDDLPGTGYKKGEEYIKNTKRKIKKNLDEFPLPAWDLVQIDLYQNAWQKHGYFSINIATTRGCPYKCNWCAKPIYGNIYNSRSPQNVVDEIKYMQSLFDFDHIWFCDDIFGLKPNWVIEYSDLLHQSNIQIPFKIQSRADLLVKDQTIRALADAGCDEVWIGAESGSQKILDAMDKGTTVEQIAEATLKMRAYGINPCFFLQLGYTGESKEDIEMTEKLLLDLMPHDIGISVSYPLPGTVFYDRVKDKMGNKNNWTHSDELALMYPSTFSPKYYKRLHRYLHKKYRAKQAALSWKSKEPINWRLFLSWFYFKPMSMIEKFKLTLSK